MNIKYFLLYFMVKLSNAFNLIFHHIPKQIVKLHLEYFECDSIGHNVLHGIKVIIDFLLDHNEIVMQYKKPAILFLIEHTHG